MALKIWFALRTGDDVGKAEVAALLRAGSVASSGADGLDGWLKTAALT